MGGQHTLHVAMVMGCGDDGDRQEEGVSRGRARRQGDDSRGGLLIGQPGIGDRDCKPDKAGAPLNHTLLLNLHPCGATGHLRENHTHYSHLRENHTHYRSPEREPHTLQVT